MAAEVYSNGKNAEVKKLAQQIYHAQDGEIKQMKEWLKKRGQSERSGGISGMRT